MVKSALVKWVLSAACVAFLMTGCESGEGDDSLSDTGSGSATVSGVLDSISSDYVPAAVQGITVDLVQDGKTILRTVTKADGSFTFYGVPAGAFTLVFHIEGAEVARPLTVAEQADGSSPPSLVLGKVEVSSKGAIEDVVEVEAEIEVVVVVEPEPVADAAPSPEALKLMEEIKLLKEKIEYSKKKYAYYEQKLSETGDTDITKLQAEYKQLKVKYADLESQHVEAKAKYAALRRELAYWEHNNPDQKPPSELTDAISKTLATMSSLELNMKELDSQMYELNAKIEKLSQEGSGGSKEILAILAEIKEHIAKLEAELAALEKKLAHIS